MLASTRASIEHEPLPTTRALATMSIPSHPFAEPCTTTFDEFVQLADYSLMDTLNADPDATGDGDDRRARQVFSGHFVPVTPTPLAEPEYVAHSSTFFKELGLSDELALDEKFRQVFSGDLSAAHEPMRQVGWATGMHCRFMAPNISKIVHSVLAMGMAMVERYLYLKESSTAGAGKCS